MKKEDKQNKAVSGKTGMVARIHYEVRDKDGKVVRSGMSETNVKAENKDAKC